MSIRALAFSSSPEMRVEALPEPKLILPGCLRHSATNSCAVVASTLGLTIRNTGARPISVTGSKSLIGS